MEQNNQEKRKLVWEARIVIAFELSKLRLNILVVESDRDLAEAKAIEWAKQYAKDHYEHIGKRIDYYAVVMQTAD